MSYSVNLVQCRNTTYTALIYNSYQGFPRPFRYFLLSMWGCLGSSPTHGSQIISFNNINVFGLIQLTRTQLRIRLIPAVSSTPSIDAYYAVPVGDVLQHLLVSVDGVGQIAQVYANDQPAAVSSGGWVGPPSQFDITGLNFQDWMLNSSGSAAPGPGQGDVFAAAPTAFFDLSVTANRRRFINADLTAVDLGAAALDPLGVAPQIWLTGRSGVPDDFCVNRGSGGGTWTTVAPLTFQAPGTCTSPMPPPPEPDPVWLAMDDVIVTAEAGLSSNSVSLRWSDDRGHSWSNPVTQPFGAVGEYDRSMQWNRLGYARDRIFSLSWSVPCATALQGAWITAEPGDGKGKDS